LVQPLDSGCGSLPVPEESESILVLEECMSYCRVPSNCHHRSYSLLNVIDMYFGVAKGYTLPAAAILMSIAILGVQYTWFNPQVRISVALEYFLSLRRDILI
jgi:hypothetical protein